MHYYKFLIDKYKYLSKTVIYKKNHYIDILISNKDAYFISVGLFCPFIAFIYKIYLEKDYTVFPPLFNIVPLGIFLEGLVVYLFLPYILFFFICNKKYTFYNKIYKKIDFFFLILGFFYKVMYLLCKNLLIGCFFVILFSFLYLYLIYIESTIHYFKILVIPPTFALYLFLDQSEKNSYLLKTHLFFSPIREKLKERHYRNNIESMSQFCTIPLLILFKLNFDILNSITKINSNTNEYILCIEEKINGLNDAEKKEKFQKLKEKKDDIFQSHFKNIPFYKASIYVYGPLKKPQSFEEICNEIKNFPTNL